MARASKFPEPVGNLPVLSYLPPRQLAVDASYQRSIEGKDSQNLIRAIAAGWNWDLCQSLVVARRASSEGSPGGLFVIDGQHRWAAARLRGDIQQLPCVVVDYADAAAEARTFVKLNKARRALGVGDVFRAALASGKPEAVAIDAAMKRVGLTVAHHSNYLSWKPGMASNIGGIQNAWRKYGAEATSEALAVLAEAFKGEVLRYAGTLFPGIVAVCAEECRPVDGVVEGAFDADRRAQFLTRISQRGQMKLRDDVMQVRTDDANLGMGSAAVRVFSDLQWPDRAAAREARKKALVSAAPAPAVAAFTFKPDGLGDGPVGFGDGCAWCTQCEMRIDQGQAEGCKSRFCSLRKVEA